MNTLTTTFRAIRNIAIIAHVDHGKTTLVDAMLKQSHIFRDNQQVGELIMDSNELERERGITILAKNTAIFYQGVKINIIDTPGHADFSGEVERVLNMADGCLLVIDAVDGPMPQTRFVLQHALRRNLKPIVVVNKIDMPAARPAEVVGMVQDLFLELATDAEQLDFPILYAAAREGYAVATLQDEQHSMAPLFDAILKYVPPPAGDSDGGFQMLIAALLHDNHIGQIAIGRVARGVVAQGDRVVRVQQQGETTSHKVTRLFVFEGLARKEVAAAVTGDIIALAGVDQIAISDTIAAADNAEALPAIDISEPTVQMTFGVNTSPFTGRDGRHLTSRQLRERLFNELQTNVGLRVHETASPDTFLVLGRGELHLSILIETMRREGGELQVSRPQAVLKEVNGRTLEPFEVLTLDVAEEYVGPVTEQMGSRLARMTNMSKDGRGRVRLEFKVPTRGLIGSRSALMRLTQGNVVINTLFSGYEPMQGEIRNARMGALVSAETGAAVTYGLNNAQQRGMTFIDPGTPVYEGMIVGVHVHPNDLNVNICKEKKMTNVRSSTSDIAIKLTPPIRMSLEQCLDFLADDEILEVTPSSIRLRKRVLGAEERYRMGRSKVRAGK